MKDKGSKRILQKRFESLTSKRNKIQYQLSSIKDDYEIVKKLKVIRSLDAERYRLSNQLRAA